MVGATAGTDDSTLIPQASPTNAAGRPASSRTDRVRRATGGTGGSHSDAVEIELPETTSGGSLSSFVAGSTLTGPGASIPASGATDAGHSRLRGRTADAPLGVSGSINAPVTSSVTQAADLSNAFAIDDEDEEESETAGLAAGSGASGARRGRHV